MTASRAVIVGIDPSPHRGTGLAVAYFDNCWNRISTATDIGDGLCVARFNDLLSGIVPDLVLIENPSFNKVGSGARAANAWGAHMATNHPDWDCRYVCPVDWQWLFFGPVTVANTVKARSMKLAEIYASKAIPSDDVADAVMLTEYGKKLKLGLALKTTKVTRSNKWPRSL